MALLAHGNKEFLIWRVTSAQSQLFVRSKAGQVGEEFSLSTTRLSSQSKLHVEKEKKWLNYRATLQKSCIKLNMRMPILVQPILKSLYILGVAGVTVLLFPSTADRAKHYSTSNGVYGDFYGTTIREIKSNYDRYGECNQKIAEVSEQLQIAKACLDGVDYRDATLDQGHNRPRGPCCYGASLRGKPNCECRLRMPLCLTPCDFYRPLAPVEWNCGQPLRPCNEKSDPEFTTRRNDCAQPLGPNDENMCNSPVGPGDENKCSSCASAARDCRQQREPEYLEDHVRRYHPHLAPKPQVLPKVIFGQSFRPATGGAYARGVGSGGGFGVGLNSEVMSSRSNARSQKRPGSPPLVAKKTVLPATSRYNFYRYYGHAGQGAKTSKDFCPQP